MWLQDAQEYRDCAYKYKRKGMSFIQCRVLVDQSKEIHEQSYNMNIF